MKKLIFLIVFLFSSAFTRAQQTTDTGMADTMRSSGKIYVVITTIAIIFAGLAVFLFMIDRRLAKIEKQNRL